MSSLNPEINKPAWHYLLDGLSVLCVVASIVVISINYAQLPDIIPTHYNASGVVDGTGSKNAVWFLPVISIVLFIIVFTLSRYPSALNYPVKITEDNASKQYTLAVSLLKVINFLVAATFLYLTWATVETALQYSQGLSSYFMLTTLALLFGSIIIYMMKASRD